MLKKLASLSLALVMFAGVMATTADDADARRRGGAVAAGVAAGIIGLGILGATANSRGRTYREPACYRGPRECRRGPDRCWYNRYGDYVCRRGELRCFRRTYCD